MIQITLACRKVFFHFMNLFLWKRIILHNKIVILKINYSTDTLSLDFDNLSHTYFCPEIFYHAKIKFGRAFCAKCALFTGGSHSSLDERLIFLPSGYSRLARCSESKIVAGAESESWNVAVVVVVVVSYPTTHINGVLRTRAVQSRGL